MNDTDTIARLRAELDDRHLTRPVDDVLARGRALRIHRRRRPFVLAAVAALVVGGVTATATLGRTSPAFADWSSTPEVAPPEVVAAIDAGCRADLDQPATATLALVDRRGANAVAVYTSARGDQQCTRFQGAGGPGDAGWWTQGGTVGPSVVIGTGVAFQVVDISSGVNVHEGSMTAISGRVRADVARVTVAVSGRTVDGAVGGGAFDVWWPAVGSDTTSVRLTAYASGGTQVGVLDLTVAGFGTG